MGLEEGYDKITASSGRSPSTSKWLVPKYATLKPPHAKDTTCMRRVVRSWAFGTEEKRDLLILRQNGDYSQEQLVGQAIQSGWDLPQPDSGMNCSRS